MQRRETCGANFENGGVVFWTESVQHKSPLRRKGKPQLKGQRASQEMSQEPKIGRCLLTGVAC